MRVGLLGPFEVRGPDGAVVEVPGVRLRALLAALALEPGRIVTRSRLVDWIWGEQPPSDEVNALQALVSRLRRVLPNGVIEADAGGYRLAVAAEAVDVWRFEQLVGQARGAEPAERAELLRSGLGLWRGSAMADIALHGSDVFDAAVTRLDELYVAALGDRVDADIRLGRGSEMVSELIELVATYPLREGFVAALMRALAEAGRGNEALTVFQRTRERLAEELGADPSAELSALHTALLRGELGERADSHRTNLRAALTSFVGKDESVAAVAGLAVKHRLVTLTGAGGSGKTRLAMETARRMLAELADGAWLVELASVRAGDPSVASVRGGGEAGSAPGGGESGSAPSVGEVAQAALSALGLRDQALLGGARGGEPMDRLVAAVRERAILLVLDNCEHVIEAAAEFADRLLGECRRVRIIATSREPLGIIGEVLWQVEPLALPAQGAEAAEVGGSAAVRLLRDRAELVRKDIGADPQTLAAMARICRALDGMPLAIELAAARLRTMSVDQLASRLDDRFRLLTGGSRTALPRHKTLRAVVDWSWDLLTEAERAVLRRLSVFAGGAGLEAAEWVCGDEALGVPAEPVFDVLTALIDKSLVVADGDEAPRYRMLNTIREYAAHRLVEAGESEAARRAHLGYFTELAERADPYLRRAEQLEWLATVGAEHDNISAALRGAVAEGWAPEAIRLAGAAGWYYYLGGHRAEGAELCVAAVSLDGEVADEARALANLLVTIFITSGVGGDQYQAREWIQEAHRLTRRGGYSHPLLGFVAVLERMLEGPAEFLPAFEPLIAGADPWVRAQARLSRARLRYTLGGDETDVDLDLDTALAEFRALGDRMGISFALRFLGDRLAMLGELAQACEHYEEAAVALAEVGALEDVVGLRARQAELYWLFGDERASAAAMAQAQRYAGGMAWPDTVAELALAKARLAYWRGEPDNAREHLATVRTVLGDADMTLVVRSQTMTLYGYLTEDLEESRACQSEAFKAAVEHGYPPATADVLIGIADLALRQGRYEQAVQLLAAGDEVRGTPDHSLPDVSRIATQARKSLGDTVFTEAILAGQGRDWRELAEAALAP